MSQPKYQIQFVCQQCGSVFPRWHGKCPACNAWNSITEETVIQEKTNPTKASSLRKKTEPMPLQDVEGDDVEIIPTQISELDRVLGKGLVSGSIILLSGEPGIGKSTLALQLAQSVARNQRTVLYITGEESMGQVHMRSKRLGENAPQLLVYSETNLVEILKAVKKYRPDVIILDSIQVVYHPDIPSAVGSIHQVRQCANDLIQVLKDANAVGIIIGHITKDGTLAGPKVLEHLVDCILFFEGERNQKYRLLRCFKNRFANTSEIGIFEMSGKGLIEITQSAELFIDETTLYNPGSMVTAIMEGSRVLLVEVQALVVDSGFGMAKRTFSGVDLNRANLMIATMEKKLRLKLSSKDIFLNIIGGLKIKEPALDLAMVLAMISSLQEKPLQKKIGVVGEVGLTGEIRAVSNIEKRLNEFEKMGFTHCILPMQNKVGDFWVGKTIQPIFVQNIAQASKVFLEGAK